MIKSRRIKHFIALVKYGHFGQAASALGISQPALSKSIQSLEADIGASLLDRQHGRLTLTAFGELVFARCRVWLTEEEDLRSQIALLANKTIGNLNVALGPFPSMTSGYIAAAQLLSQHPTLKAHIDVADWRQVASRVISHEVDLGIAAVSALKNHPDLFCEAFGRHQGYMFCRSGHPLLDGRTITLADLFRYPWVCTRIPWRATTNISLDLGAAGTIDALSGDFIPAIEISHSPVFASFIKDSDALAITLLSTMEQELTKGSVMVVPQKIIPLNAQYGFIYLKNRSLPPAALAYMHLILEVEENIKQREAKLAKKFISLKKQAGT